MLSFGRKPPAAEPSPTAEFEPSLTVAILLLGAAVAVLYSAISNTSRIFFKASSQQLLQARML